MGSVGCIEIRLALRLVAAQEALPLRVRPAGKNLLAQ